MVDVDELRLVWQRIDVQTNCPHCGHAMWTIERSPSQIVECVNSECPEAGVRWQVNAPRYGLQELQP
jgi:hypothetical protein